MPDGSMIERGRLGLQTRLMPLAVADAALRTAEVTWTTGAGVRRYDYERQRFYNEMLSLNPAHVQMDRFASGNSPLLDSHTGYGVASVLGVVDRASLNPPVATVRFSQRDAVEPVFKDVRDGILKNVSVGYRVGRYEMTPPPTGEGDWTYLAVDWTPMELSIVPIGADAGATFRAQPPGNVGPCEFVLPPVDHERVHEIRSRTTLCGLGEDFANRLIYGGTSLDACFRQIVDAIAAEQPQTPIGVSMQTTDNTDGAVIPQVRLMGEALAARYNCGTASDQARQYRRTSLVEMAQQCLELRGIRTSMMSDDQILQRTMTTTSDFTGLLSDTGNRLLRKGYDSYKGGLKQCARQITAPDFRAINKLMLSEAPALRKVLPGGEVKRGPMTESKASYNLETFARIFGITRQALINDDLEAFATLATSFGRAAAEFECSQLVTLLTGNPTMSDGVALFHASHGNKSGSPGAISVTTLGAAKSAMRLQKGLDGVTPIDATPAFLIVPAALEAIALQFVTQISPALATSVNPFSGNLQVIVDPRLDAVSATVWYLAADPGAIDTIEYAYLDSAPGLQLETRMGFDVEGLEMKARLDFGCSIYEHRGLYQNA